MAERGARPNVPKLQRRLLGAARSLTSPLLPDDYLELLNPLWSTRELRGRIVRIRPETDEAATLLIRPGYAWRGHTPGQYLRIGVEVDGVHHWRAYSLTSDPDRPDGFISITVKHVETGRCPRTSSGRSVRGRSSASAASRAPSCCRIPCPAGCSSSPRAAASRLS
jgi:hypothetical protein